MTLRVSVKPELLRWACARSGRGMGYLENRFKKLPDWEDGTVQPTLKQLESFAKITYTPFGYLFLDQPPKDTLPIPDFRTLSGSQDKRPGANLLDTIYMMQQRSAWLRESLLEDDCDPLGFVGSARLSDPPEGIAHEMRRLVGLEDGWVDQMKGWQEAVGRLRRGIEELGVMAVMNGIVGNNTHRKLDVKEFRGFALCDAYAPLIFVNGADNESARMFTLAHELAHIWLGRAGVSGFEGVIASNGETEKFCDAVAAEFLVPKGELMECWREASRTERPYETVARRFKVSPVVAARRALDLKLTSRKGFFEFYDKYTAEENYNKKKTGGGGDFYSKQNARVGDRFAIEIIRAAKEGRVSFRDAYLMTGLRGKAFDEYSKRLGKRLIWRAAE